MIKVACECGQRFQAKDEWVGKKTKCPKCGAPLTIPAATPEGQKNDQLATEPVPAKPPVSIVASPSPAPAVTIQAAPDPAALPELLAAFERFRKPAERLAVICGSVFFLSLVAAGVVWYFYGWLLALAVVVGGLAIFGIIFGLSMSGLGRRAVAAVAAIENKYTLTHEQSLELFRSDAESAKVDEFKDFVSAVWGEDALKKPPAAAIAAGEQLDISALDQKAPVSELRLRTVLQPEVEQFRAIWLKHDPSGRKFDGTGHAFTSVAERAFDSLLPSLPAPRICVGCGFPPGQRTLRHGYVLELIVRIQVNTGSPFDQTPEQKRKLDKEVFWPLCDGCAGKMERTLRVLKQLPDALQPVGYGLTGMFSGSKRTDQLQLVQRALREREFDLDRDLLLPPVIKEFKREIYFEAATALVQVFTLGKVLELIVSADQQLVMTFPNRASRRSVRSVAESWEIAHDYERETPLWPACWEVRNPLAGYRVSQ